MAPYSKTTALPPRSPGALILVFIRHGQAGERGQEKERGASLSALGKRQAVRVARRLEDQHFNHIYSSDMRRANQTFEAIRKYHQETPCTVTAELREITHYHFASILPAGAAVTVVKARFARLAERLSSP